MRGFRYGLGALCGTGLSIGLSLAALRSASLLAVYSLQVTITIAVFAASVAATAGDFKLRRAAVAFLLSCSVNLLLSHAVFDSAYNPVPYAFASALENLDSWFESIDKYDPSDPAAAMDARIQRELHFAEISKLVTALLFSLAAGAIAWCIPDSFHRQPEQRPSD